MYHGITEEDAPAFREQLSYLAHCFHVVPLDRTVDRLAQQTGPGADEIVLTFDDGLRNHLTVVYPILQELRLPATFFVCPGLLGTGRWLWNHEVRCRLEMLCRERLNELAGRLRITCRSAEEIVEWMKGLRPAARSQAEEAIKLALLEFAPTARQKQACDLMDWDDLLSLDPKLITVGSHTHTHSILTTLEAAQMEFELVESRRRLEQKLNRPAGYFCYPNGAHDARVREAVKRIYRAAVTTECGLVGGNGHDLHLLPRIPSAESPALMAWRLHRPGA